MGQYTGEDIEKHVEKHVGKDTGVSQILSPTGQAITRKLRKTIGWTQPPRSPLGRAIQSLNHRTLLPKLKQLKLEAIVRVTGLTKSACSRIRAGHVVPHPRHWEALADLVSS